MEMYGLLLEGLMLYDTVQETARFYYGLGFWSVGLCDGCVNGDRGVLRGFLWGEGRGGVGGGGNVGLGGMEGTG